MMNWTLARDGLTASRTLENGQVESRLVSAIEADELALALPAPAPTAAELLSEKAVMLAQAKELREKVLNRLTGIQLNTTDAPDIAAIKAARLSLLDITIDTGVVAATDGASTKAAIMAAWKAIAATLAAAAPTAASVFVGLGM